MDPQQIAIVFGVFGLVQAAIFTVLWIIVFLRTGHDNGWVLIALFPVFGLIVSMGLSAFLSLGVSAGSTSFLVFQLVPMAIGFLFSVAPLFLFVLRLTSGKLRVTHDTDAPR